MQKFISNIAVGATFIFIVSSTASAAGLDAACGGIAGIKCDSGLFCDPKPGLCGGTDLAGKCTKIPAVCTDVYKPVCGCDGNTYSNDCNRQMKSVAKKTDGKC